MKKLVYPLIMALITTICVAIIYFYGKSIMIKSSVTAVDTVEDSSSVENSVNSFELNPLPDDNGNTELVDDVEADYTGLADEFQNEYVYKYDIDSIAFISDYITEGTLLEWIGERYYYDMSDVFQTIVDDTNIHAVVIDANVTVTEKVVIRRSDLDIYSNNRSYILFKNSEGFYLDERNINYVSIHNLTIEGLHGNEDAYLLYINVNGRDDSFYNLNFQNACNGIFVDGWVLKYYNIRISGMSGVGMYIRRSDNFFDSFYICACRKQGVIIESANNRITNFEVLTCGEECESVSINKSKRNFISNFEIQDIFVSALVCNEVSNSIMEFNIDGNRTNLQDISSVELATFNSCCDNIITIISSKYGKAGITQPDYIWFNTYSYNNDITATLDKVTITGNMNNKINTNVDFILSDDMRIYPELSYVGCQREEDGYGYTTENVNWGGIRVNNLELQYDGINKIYVEMLVKTDDVQNHVMLNQGGERFVRETTPDGFVVFRGVINLVGNAPVISMSPIENSHVEIIDLKIFDVTGVDGYNIIGYS